MGAFTGQSFEAFGARFAPTTLVGVPRPHIMAFPLMPEILSPSPLQLPDLGICASRGIGDVTIPWLRSGDPVRASQRRWQDHGPRRPPSLRREVPWRCPQRPEGASTALAFAEDLFSDRLQNQFAGEIVAMASSHVLKTSAILRCSASSGMRMTAPSILPTVRPNRVAPLALEAK